MVFCSKKREPLLPICHCGFQIWLPFLPPFSSYTLVIPPCCLQASVAITANAFKCCFKCYWLTWFIVLESFSSSFLSIFIFFFSFRGNTSECSPINSLCCSQPGHKCSQFCNQFNWISRVFCIVMGMKAVKHTVCTAIINSLKY